jgi:hypothetical protein
MPNLSKHIWEGWTVQDFIDELEVTFAPWLFQNEKEISEWCKSEQPFYKKRIPEVENHFIKIWKQNKQ